MTTAALTDLQQGFRGTVILPADAHYEVARKVFNGMIDRRPAIIARCEGVDDVKRAIRFGRDADLLVAVRGGGHGVAGYATCDGGLVIDLSGMKGIRVDPTGKTVRADSGLTWGEFDEATQAHGLATTGGEVSTTGIAGLTLGGGIGWLLRKYGLVCDNLISVDLVTADGESVRASASENADLFWGVRGGGGNFGIVTSFEYRLHPVGPVLGGMILHPLARATEVMRFWRDFVREAPDELTSNAAVVTSPDGSPVLAISLCCLGSIEAAERTVRPLRAFGAPLADMVRPMSYNREMQTIFDAAFPAGRHHYWKSSLMGELSDPAIEMVVDQFSRVTSPQSAILIEHLEGAVGRVRPEETAFDGRAAQFSFLSCSIWSPGEESDRHIRWTREIFTAMRPFVAEGVYVNYVDGDEGDERVRAAYGRIKYDRLVALKTKYDPTNFFRLNHNIAPAPTARPLH